MRRSQTARWTIAAALAVCVVGGVTAYLIACVSFLTQFHAVTVRRPANTGEFLRGDLGVVRPPFARRYLVQAYRVMNGRAPLGDAAPVVTAERSDTTPWSRWRSLRDSALGTTDERDRMFRSVRQIGQYQYFENCTHESFEHAIKTLRARITRYGAGSGEAREWTEAQVAVFRNCDELTLVLPSPAPASARPDIRADRAYQTAAALFYGMHYAEAAGAFEAIAADPTSEWRPYGRYLAARARIRQSTVVETDSARIAQLQRAAQTDLEATLADASAAFLHGSARGLIDFLAARLRPADRLHELGRALVSSRVPTEEDLSDYDWLMERLGAAAATSVGDDDLTDWMSTFQGDGEPALGRALDRWRATRSTPWLVAALWRVPVQHAAVDELLAAAAAIDRPSPAFATVAFLRVRLLVRLGRVDAARAVLASLPTRPESGFGSEAMNLVKAERFMLARNLDELLVNASRAIVVQTTPLAETVSFDWDAAAVLNNRLPLDSLVAASSSPLLPERLRVRVATAAFARAIVLGREDAGVRAATALRAVAPGLAADLNRYLRASTPDARHAAGILFLLRTPGAHTYVRALDDDRSYEVVDPSRQFDHQYPRNWWCQDPQVDEGTPESELLPLLYGNPPRSGLLRGRSGPADIPFPFPAFVSAGEREQVAREMAALRAAGSARSYLAIQTLEWARRDPANTSVAEALARVVEGWRWGWACRDDYWKLPRQAFETLHRRYPRSEWAKRTKYWYGD